MEAFSNPFVMILFVLTMIVISLSVISVRIQKSNKIQKKTFEQSQIKSDAEYSSIGVYFQGGRTLVKCLDCAELISLEAKVCKHCRTNVVSHVVQVKSKILEFEKNHKELEVKQRITNLKKSGELGFAMAIAATVVAGVLIIPQIMGDKSAPTKKQELKISGTLMTNIQNLAKEWKVLLSECGFDQITITLNMDSAIRFENYPYPIKAEGKFKSTPETRECLTNKLDDVYAKFNTQGNRWPSRWFIGNTSSGSWENDYADAWETYSLRHEWLVPDSSD
jgi:hypothetical protein